MESAKDLRSLYNLINNNLQALKSLKRPVEHWDDLLIVIILNKLDFNTKREWERQSITRQQNTVADLLEMIMLKCEILENTADRTNRNRNTTQNKQSSHAVHAAVVATQHCYFCKDDHAIFRCDSFLALHPHQRAKRLSQLGICANCLKGKHNLKEYKAGGCRRCGKKHNTLLHDIEDSSNDKKDISTSETQHKPTTEIVTPVSANTSNSSGFLSTIMVKVKDAAGKFITCRALLDSGSTVNFITEDCSKRLNLKQNRSLCSLYGIESRLSTADKETSVVIHSLGGRYSKHIHCIVIKSITGKIPQSSFSTSNIRIPPHLPLADPHFNVPQPVDILLGAAVFWDILQTQHQKLQGTDISLRKTRFGWIIGGGLPVDSNQGISCVAVNKHHFDMRKFWQLEEVNQPLPVAEEDAYCEEHFKANCQRGKDGKFVVKVPFKDKVNLLGTSFDQAQKRFFSLERKLSRLPQLQSQYTTFMEEYVKLGHMTEVEPLVHDEELNNYIPHHAVVRNDHLTTKVRVVFVASMKSDSGLSLNDVQYVGPPIQQDIFNIILNFRLHKYVLNADIEKMYSMIWIHPNQRRFHRILWRQNLKQPLKTYELNTVTYGTASARYLAIRCLHQVAMECQQDHPQVSKILKENFYVDDLVYSTDSKEELLQIQRQITTILKEAGFHLRKWLCNEPQLYKHFLVDKPEEHGILQFGERCQTKTLGVSWNAELDTIQYNSNNKSQKTTTKRSILSDISTIFDPLGLLAPIIIRGKLFMQHLWQSKCDWDDEVGRDINKQWKKFRTDLENLQKIRIDRQVLIRTHHEVQLHGFGDASIKAYGAAIYLVSRNQNKAYKVSLLCAKSRVAPLKQETLPRLELCAALLVARLADKVMRNLNVKISECHFWTDSTIVHSWIQGCPSKWKTFVANRVSEIQQLTLVSSWHHVPGRDNPADIIFRGSSVSSLQSIMVAWTEMVKSSLPMAESKQKSQAIKSNVANRQSKH